MSSIYENDSFPMIIYPDDQSRNKYPCTLRLNNSLRQRNNFSTQKIMNKKVSTGRAYKIPTILQNPKFSRASNQQIQSISSLSHNISQIQGQRHFESVDNLPAYQERDPNIRQILSNLQRHSNRTKVDSMLEC